jgi:hypothetical protein
VELQGISANGMKDKEIPNLSAKGMGKENWYFSNAQL